MAKVIPTSEQIYTVNEPIGTKGQPIQYVVNEKGCHICLSHALDKDGYPRIQREKLKFNRGSRYIYSLFHGEIEKGKVVMHTCDNPGCINPDHLKLGTVAENNLDKLLKGRANIRGQILTYDQIYYIRFISEESTKELALRFNVNETTIRRIKRGVTHKEVTKSLANHTNEFNVFERTCKRIKNISYRIDSTTALENTLHLAV